MKTVRVTIEKTEGHYSAFATNVKGVYGGGDTPEEAKKSILEAIDLLVKYNEPGNIPAILRGDYTIVYKFDTQSLLNYYKGVFTKPGLHKVTGISPKLLQNYSDGVKKPGPDQAKKIEAGLHNLAEELLALEL